jgi:hypothetical protein
MKSYTVYNQPVETSEQYAHVRDIYDGMEAAGLASFDGSLEVSFARAAQVINTDLVVPHLYRLLGTHLRVTICYFAKLVGWKERRRRQPFFDNDDRLEKVQGSLDAMGGEEAEVLARAVHLARQDKEMRRFVHSTMAGMCAA